MEPTKTVVDIACRMMLEENATINFTYAETVRKVIEIFCDWQVSPLEKRLEETEEMIRALQCRNKDMVAEYQNMLEETEKQVIVLKELNENNVGNWELQCKDSRNAALEEAAQISDDWGNCNASVQIRSLKEE